MLYSGSPDVGPVHPRTVKTQTELDQLEQGQEPRAGDTEERVGGASGVWFDEAGGPAWRLAFVFRNNTKSKPNYDFWLGVGGTGKQQEQEQPTGTSRGHTSIGGETTNQGKVSSMNAPSRNGSQWDCLSTPDHG